MTVLALVGGAYGSEGKGVVASGLAHLFEASVRTGGPNAGHSFYWDDNLYKMRQVPCAWVNEQCELFIGAGAVVDADLLQLELAGLPSPGYVTIDPQATIVLPVHQDVERDAGLRALIGSTTEGVGEARVAKLRRRGEAVLAGDWQWDYEGVVVGDVSVKLAQIHRAGGSICLEGTQGALLSLHHGRYPYVTSADTNAAQLAADAGLPPSAVEHVHLVVRTFPIRVAGNSGPTGGAEIGWQRFIDSGAVQVPERTTVTKLQRRIFEFSDYDLRRVIRLNDPCGIWLTFGDYVDPSIAGTDDIDEVLAGPVGDWVAQHIEPTGVPLLGVGTGGPRWAVAPTGRECDNPWNLHPTRPWPVRFFPWPLPDTERAIKVGSGTEGRFASSVTTEGQGRAATHRVWEI